MPRRRWTLTSSEQLENRKIAERLNAWGADLDLGSLRSADSAWIQITPSPLLSCVRVLPKVSFFEIHVRIVILKQKRTILQVALTSAEWDMNADLVEERRTGRSKFPRYVFADGSGYEKDQALNHHLGPHSVHARGDLLEGLLLFESFEPAPLRFVRGMYMPLFLSFQDQFDSVCDKKIALRVERSAGRTRPVVPMRRRTGLFERAERMLSVPESAAEAAGFPSEHRRELEERRGKKKESEKLGLCKDSPDRGRT